MPGFSERVFEFCYNSEFCDRYRAVLAAAPNIPSLRAEKELGYDVEFILRRGPRVRSLFLQHKISHFAENRVGNNARFYDSHRGPYFRFAIDTNQQNTLIDTYNPLQGAWMYCAPRFHKAADLDRHFRNRTIVPNSVWVSPLKIGRIADADRHNVTYDPGAVQAYFHSEPSPVQTITIEGELPQELSRVDFSWERVLEFEEVFFSMTTRADSAPRLPEEFRRAPRIEKVQYILGHVFGLSWYLIPE